MDLKQYLIDKHGGHASKQSSSKNEIALPACPKCGKEEDHFNFNIATKKGGCLSCGFGIHNGIALIQVLEQVSRKEARNIYLLGLVGKSKLDAIEDMLTKKNIEEPDETEEHQNVDLPEEFELMIDVLRDPVKKIPKVFFERRYPDYVISEYQLGFCLSGNYQARIIFPVYCAGKKSFVARKTHEWMNKKYKNPSGSKHSQLLYGYDLVSSQVIIFVCEGPTDVLRLRSYGWNAVCTFGKKISNVQIDLIFDLDPLEVVALFDGEAVKQNKKAFKKLSLRFKTSYILLPEDKDPDNISENELSRLYDDRFGISKIDDVQRMLKHF